MKGQMATGEITGTGADIDIPLGFNPTKVVVYNPNDAGAVDATMTWIKGMADGTGFKGTATGTALIDTLGITPYAGVAGATPAGFTIGTDADLNVVAEDMVWEAWGSDN